MKSNFKKIGLIGGGFKPFHKGHYEAIKIASNENDLVYLYVSTSDRMRKNEYTISWKQMEKIWNEYVNPALPNNIKSFFVPVPITPIMDLLYEEDSLKSNITYSIYSDEKDLTNNFSRLKTKLNFLVKNNQLNFIVTPRTCSSTKMRLCLQNKNKNEFVSLLPIVLQNKGLEIYKFLSS